MKKNLIYIFLVAFMLSSVVLFDVFEVRADLVNVVIADGSSDARFICDTYQFSDSATFSNPDIITDEIFYYFDVDGLGLSNVPSGNVCKFDFSAKNMQIQFLSAEAYLGCVTSTKFINRAFNLSLVYTDEMGTHEVFSSSAYPAESNYNFEALGSITELYFKASFTASGYSGYNNGGLPLFAPAFYFGNFSFTAIYDDYVEDAESEVPSETESEVPSETESETPSEIPDDSENVGSDDLTVNETAIYNALTAYFDDNPLDVVVLSDDGINKKLDDLSFSEVCLLLIFLLQLGKSILHIIGGRSWNK